GADGVGLLELLIELDGAGGFGARRRLGPPLQVIERRVGGDPIEPGAHGPAPLELVERAPRAQQRLLQRILRVVRGAEDAGAMGVELVAVELDELGVLGGLARPQRSATSCSPRAVLGRASDSRAAARNRPITTGAVCLNASVNGRLSSSEKKTVPTSATPSAPPSCSAVLNIPPA